MHILTIFVSTCNLLFINKVYIFENQIVPDVHNYLIVSKLCSRHTKLSQYQSACCNTILKKYFNVLLMFVIQMYVQNKA